ncbi:vomeronasal type-2 receptor 26-like [Podarcis muralis]
MSGIFKIPQLSYGFALTDKTQFPFAYQMVPKEEIQYRGIVKLLLHFGWTWIGLFAPDNDSGERFLSSLTPMMISNGICVAFSEKIQQRTLYQILILRKPPVMWRKVNVSVYYGDASNRFDPIIMVQRILKRVQIWGKVWITTAFQDINMNLSYDINTFKYIHGSLSFIMKTRKWTKYEYYKPWSGTTLRFWDESFHCLCSEAVLPMKGWIRCTEKAKLEVLPQEEVERALSQDSYITYSSVQAVALALNSAYSSRFKQVLMMGREDRWGLERLQPWQSSSTLS